MPKESIHHVVLSEQQIAALRGFEVSDVAQESDGRFLARPVVGVVLDHDFINAHPMAIAKLRQIAPRIDGSDPIYDLSADPAGLLDWQLSRAFGLSGRFLADLGAGHLEIGRLQQMMQEHLEALQEAQRVVHEAVPPQPRLGVFLPPGSTSLQPSDLRDVVSISQNSKREFRAVHAFEIHVAEPNRDPSPVVVIRLLAAHSRGVLGTWTVPAHTLDVGWNRFDCPFMPRPLDEPVLIEIRWEPDAAPRFALSLGEITADPRLGLVRSDGTVDDRSLAVRIYTGAPGLRLPFQGWGRLPDGYPAAERPSQVIIDELLPTVEYFGGLEEPRAELLRYVDERAGLFLHPSAEGTHVAVIRNVRIDDVRAITADVTLAHDLAAPTEFGLFAAPVDMPLTLKQPSPKSHQPKWLRVGNPRRKSENDAVHDNFHANATWLRLKAREQGQLVFEPTDTLGDSFNIYLATRQTGGGTNHAMAHFLHLVAIREKRQA
ncbi:hypothetical protein DA075_34885 (plasmid) [Methylobacterium currus]|uniref:Uncharacterized protein n=2 Tax=Methylobacterium currus TaxID=2051553 RepID=A0A2R4WWZ3_9HYPH|nr:hypothetical protein DA075_34885 [Methylobacterium currus]